MGWFSSQAAQLGAGSKPRQFRPERSGTVLQDLASAFGEANPAQVTDTPRTVGFTNARAEPIGGKEQYVANGWINRPSQTVGMSTFYVDQIQRQPDPEVGGITVSAINHSRYVPFYHQRGGHWIWSKWDPIFRFAMTAMDMRFQVGKIAPLTNQQPGNIPGTARMGPFAAPYRAAWQVPRFSTEPYTIIPQAH